MNTNYENAAKTELIIENKKLRQQLRDKDDALQMAKKMLEKYAAKDVVQETLSGTIITADQCKKIIRDYSVLLREMKPDGSYYPVYELRQIGHHGGPFILADYGENGLEVFYRGGELVTHTILHKLLAAHQLEAVLEDIKNGKR